MKEEYALLPKLSSASRAALVTFLFTYAVQNLEDLGAWSAWCTAGQAFDPWSDTLRRRR